MKEISLSLAKELREKIRKNARIGITTISIMECEQALRETNGDIEKSMIWLKRKGYHELPAKLNLGCRDWE